MAGQELSSELHHREVFRLLIAMRKYPRLVVIRDKATQVSVSSDKDQHD
jgi:hypothetical protein